MMDQKMADEMPYMKDHLDNSGDDERDDTTAEAAGSGEESLPVDDSSPTETRSSNLLRLTTYVLIPVLALALAGVAAFFRYQDATAAQIDRIRATSVQIATEGAVALLSYTPDTAEASLNAASDRLTGSFRDSYLELVRDIVIPGAKQQQISANAAVAAGSSISASRDHAQVMLFVNQTTTVGTDVPSDSASVVQVNLDNVDGRWLISGFEPR